MGFHKGKNSIFKGRDILGIMEFVEGPYGNFGGWRAWLDARWLICMAGMAEWLAWPTNSCGYGLSLPNMWPTPISILT
ncbi:hypothetical protein VNO77_19016 [Canavalia gladiata]|uniref:Uncharacterized protein n=1 Tax=Canavalia gladiata TaxID=3824 RepID=A0AAN9LQ92_CANGL